MTTRSRRRDVTVALLAVQAFVGSVVGLALLGLARRHPHRGIGAAGLLAFAVGVGLVVVAVAVTRSRTWGRPAGVTLEALIAIVALSRIGVRPISALVNLALAVTVGALLIRMSGATPAGTAAAADPPPPGPTTVERKPRSPGSELTAGGVLLALLTLVILLVALAVRSRIVFGLVVLAAVFVPLERLLALHPQRILRTGWRTDLVHFVVNGLLLNVGLFVSVVVVGSLLRAIVPGGLRSAIAGQALWLQFLEAFSVAELCGYAGHRAAHQVPFLWRFHKVHHSIRQMDWLAASHLHPIDQTFTRSCAVLPLYALGFSRAGLGGYLVVLTFQAIFIHANVRVTFGPLRWLIATPEFHHWHHANDPAAYNTNFAGEFPLIDLIFGTLHLPKGRMPSRYGIDDAEPPGYLRQLAWPFGWVSATSVDRLAVSE
ncbi:MAG: sterol desaturase family protein [Actinomycetota bacterium]|nr:sterol desaturase family protein [Actinomycetota bacterium]